MHEDHVFFIFAAVFFFSRVLSRDQSMNCRLHPKGRPEGPENKLYRQIRLYTAMGISKNVVGRQRWEQPQPSRTRGCLSRGPQSVNKLSGHIKPQCGGKAEGVQVAMLSIHGSKGKHTRTTTHVRARFSSRVPPCTHTHALALTTTEAQAAITRPPQALLSSTPRSPAPPAAKRQICTRTRTGQGARGGVAGACAALQQRLAQGAGGGQTAWGE